MESRMPTLSKSLLVFRLVMTYFRKIADFSHPVAEKKMRFFKSPRKKEFFTSKPWNFKDLSRFELYKSDWPTQAIFSIKLSNKFKIKRVLFSKKIGPRSSCFRMDDSRIPHFSYIFGLKRVIPRTFVSGRLTRR